MDTEVAELPDDALAKVFRRLPARSLAKARRVCKAWRAVVDGHALLLPYRRLLPHRLHGVFINYIDHRRPHLFARPPATSGEIDSLLGFLPSDLRNWWSVLDHCRGLLLCNMDWYNQLCVCSPATQEWALLPRRAGATRGDYAGAYLAFEPAVSRHYEVYLIPSVPEKKPLPPSVRRREVEQEERRRTQQEIDGPFCLDWLFSSSSGGSIEFAGETEEEVKERLPSSMDEDKELADDVDLGRRSMEWPPTPWIFMVFSSRTGRWEERVFDREGEPAGTIQDLGLDQPQPMMRGPRQNYAVYWQGTLYIHCRGHFITRLSLSNHKYQVIKTPAYIKSDPHAKPYLGISEKGVYFGIVQWCQLWVWILNESCGETEWILKCHVDVTRTAQHIREYGRQMDAPWILHDDNVSGINHNDHDSGAQTVPEERYEWDSDNDDFFTADKVGPAEEFYGGFDIVGFHPYKEVVFLAEFFSIGAYHLNTSRIQYLGNSRPGSYYRNYTNGIYESFVYTPCMIRERNEGSTDWSGSS